jgi:NAD(P)-dependent dehydrogenase (short-subunit alcohol dehydrogenase family)
MAEKLKNKVAVITGGNSGIGLGVAKLFASEGAKVAITGRNAKTLDAAVKELGSNAFGVVSNVNNIYSFEPLYQQVVNRFGKIDILVANAGIVLFKSLEEVTEEIFDEITGINYKGVFFTVQKALPFLNNGASIIVTSSTVADKGIAGGSVYVSSKAAERALVRVFAAELAVKKIRVNALSPGSVDTDIFLKAGMSRQVSDSMSAFFAGAVALKRTASVEEMAKGFLFLASDDSSYMTGADLTIDGGFRDL